MVIRRIMAAMAACGGACAAAAEDTGNRPDLGKLYEIRDTVCAASDLVLFLPVSSDTPTRELVYALVPADHPDVISAHVVTPDQRKWLIRHGCHSPATRQQVLANVSTVTPVSGSFDF